MTLITNVFYSLVPLSMVNHHFVSSTGFPLHFEIGGTFGLIPYFCTLNVYEHLGDRIIFEGTSQILEVKTLCEG